MNIFVTHPSPIQSARNLPDKHIVKMPLETCQMLAIIIRRHSLSYCTWCIPQPSMYTVGCQESVQSSMAHTSRLRTMSRVQPTLPQSAHLSRRYRASRTHLPQMFQRASVIRITASQIIYSCHARVSQVRPNYQQYCSISTLP